MVPKAWQRESWFGRSQHDKQGVFHTLALPYIWFYMQEEKTIHAIDIFFTHILKEAKSWVFMSFFLLLGKQKRNTWFGNLNTKYIGLWLISFSTF